jgi:hypothetical protein
MRALEAALPASLWCGKKGFRTTSGIAFVLKGAVVASAQQQGRKQPLCTSLARALAPPSG